MSQTNASRRETGRADVVGGRPMGVKHSRMAGAAVLDSGKPSQEKGIARSPTGLEMWQLPTVWAGQPGNAAWNDGHLWS
ncbi:MAG: hypothetical protein KDA91_13745 [Planctomycetaceae bacterium]|nr:hypothetical protein [Planctomycetaceae bacterium]